MTTDNPPKRPFELSEDQEARDESGVCRICDVDPDVRHNMRRHDDFWAAMDATW